MSQQVKPPEVPSRVSGLQGQDSGPQDPVADSWRLRALGVGGDSVRVAASSAEQSAGFGRPRPSVRLAETAVDRAASPDECSLRSLLVPLGHAG